MRRFVVLAIVVLVAVLAAATCSTALRRSDVAPQGAGAVPEAGVVASMPANRARAAAATVPLDPATAATPATNRVVRGTVLDATGEPVADVDIALHPLDPDGREIRDRNVIDFARTLATTRTSADGTYEMTTATPGWLAVAARKPGFAPAASLVVRGEPTYVRLNTAEEIELLIVDTSGSPVGGAEAWLLWKDAGSALVVSVTEADAAGRARVIGDIFRQDLLVRAPGRADASVDEVPEPGRVIRVVLGEGRRIAGVVVDSSGRPLAGARVVLDRERVYVADAVRTSADGTFAFDGLDARRDARGLSVDVVLDGWAEADDVDVVAGDEHVRIVLHRPATVRGVVVREDGRPAFGAEVNGRFHADEDGRFELPGIEPGRVTIYARAPSPSPSGPRTYLTGTATVEVAEGAVVDGVRIALAPPADTASLLVRVRDPDGRRVPGALVSWRCSESLGSAFVDADGTLLVAARAGPGRSVQIACSVDGPPRLEGWAERPVETSTTGAPEPFDLCLEPPGQLRLRVVDPAGRDVQAGLVHADICDRSSNTYVMPGTDREYELPASADYDVRVRVTGFAEWRTAIGPPHPRVRTETVRLQPASRLGGRLTGVGVRSHRIEVHFRDAAGASAHRDQGVDDDGLFEFDELPPGRVALRVRDGNDRVAVLREVDLPAGENVHVGDVRVGGPVTLRGVAVDATGRGVVGAFVECWDGRGLAACRPTCSRADGTWEVDLGGAVPLDVRVSRRGFATQSVAAPADARASLRVVLGPPGSVRVRIDRGMGTEAPRVLVRAPGSALSWEPPMSDDVDDPRIVVCEDLPSGPLEIVLAAGGRERAKTVEVAAGRTVECVFE